MFANSPSRTLLTFYVLAFAISWLGYLPFFFLRNPSPWWMFCLLLPGAGPAIAAGVAGRGAEGLKIAFRWQVRWYWYLVAGFTPPALMLLSNTIVGGHRSALALKPLAIAFSIGLFANPCEEIGWRGFSLPRLQALCNPALAALIIGILTALWHLPLFFWPRWSSFPLRMSDIPFLSWAAAHLAASVFFTWLYNASSRSLLIVSLFHISFNLSAALLGIGSYTVLAVVEIAGALVLLAVCGPGLGEELRTGQTIRVQDAESPTSRS